MARASSVSDHLSDSAGESIVGTEEGVQEEAEFEAMELCDVKGAPE